MRRELEFTTREAALVTEQPLNRIQKLIDAGPIPRRNETPGERRVLTDADLMFVWVVSRAFADTDLDARLKRILYERINELRRGPCSVKADELRINHFLAIRGLRKLVDELRARVEKLEKARSMVHSNPSIKGGDPVIKGTRIPVHLVARMLEQGASPSEIRENYPTLDEERIELAQFYSQANPRPGRPPKHPWH